MRGVIESVHEDPQQQRTENEPAQGPRAGPPDARSDRQGQHHQGHGNRQRGTAQPVDLLELRSRAGLRLAGL